MAVFNKVDLFVEDVGKGYHDFSTDQLALFFHVGTHTSTWGNISDLTAPVADNISSKNVTTTSWSQSGGVATLVVADATLTSSGGATGPFDIVYLYNTASGGATGKLIGYWEAPTAITVADGQDFIFDLTDGGQAVFTFE